MIGMILTALGYTIRFLDFIIFVRCILSWLPIGFNNPVSRFVYSITEPLLAPIRNMVYKSPIGGPGMMLDISPIILWILLDGAYMIVLRVAGMLQCL